MFRTKFCHLGDLALQICACLTKMFLKTTKFHEAIIDFLYVCKILSVCCQDIFANECGYKKQVCYQQHTFMPLLFLAVTQWCSIPEEQKPQPHSSGNLKSNIILSF
jgi:hypothetical protein